MIEKIFTWIWRLNGLLILGIALITLGFISFTFLMDFNRPEPERLTTNIAEDPQGKENWVLGRPKEVNGTENIYVPLVSENNEGEAEVRGKFSSNTRYRYGDSYQGFYKNILFINCKSNEMSWLFKDVDQLIETVSQLPRNKSHLYDEYEEPTETKLIIYNFHIQDSNNDGFITSDDDSALAYSLPDGTEFNVILEGYERILSTKLQDNGILSVIYQKFGVGILSNFSLSLFSEISRVELPNVGK